MKVVKYVDDNLEKIIVVFLLGAMSLIIGTQVFMRYIMKASLSWSEEVARYMFIWLVYIGISYGVKTARHIKVDAAMYIFPKKIRKYVVILGELIFLVFSIIICINAVEVVKSIFHFGQQSPAVGIPMGYIYMAPLVGFTIVSIRLVQNIYFGIKSLRGEEII